jgi:hypothetical protein
MFSKFFHTHRWQLVAVNDQYQTNYTDTGNVKNWNQRFYQCQCGARRHTDDLPSHQSHKGIAEARRNWIDIGVVPKGSYLPGPQSGYMKVTDDDREKLDPVLKYQRTLEDIQRSLGVVINRDFDLEAKYPKLKEAADEYHRRLDKYRNFEQLKGTTIDETNK